VVVLAALWPRPVPRYHDCAAVAPSIGGMTMAAAVRGRGANRPATIAMSNPMIGVMARAPCRFDSVEWSSTSVASPHWHHIRLGSELPAANTRPEEEARGSIPSTRRRRTEPMTEPPAPPITVLLVDDQRLVRTGFRSILGGEPDIEVVGEASDGVEAVQLVRATTPDVVLMDIRMPHLDGLEATRIILTEATSRVVILTTFDSDDYVYEALCAGASGFLLKDAPADQLLTAIRCAASGDALIDPTVTRRLITRLTRPALAADSSSAQLRDLTERELQVLRLIARGLSNAEIAADLVIEESTVKSHVGRILSKLGLRDRVQAVVLAYECGLVTAGS
jgi:DNA-binding NarL/FixJ family response regulator